MSDQILETRLYNSVEVCRNVRASYYIWKINTTCLVYFLNPYQLSCRRQFLFFGAQRSLCNPAGDVKVVAARVTNDDERHCSHNGTEESLLILRFSRCRQRFQGYYRK